MAKTISARVTDEIYEELERQVEAGDFLSMSRAVAHHIRWSLESEGIRQVIREELARVQVQRPEETVAANPKLERMRSKVVR